jgi:hypothetical protein
MPDMPFDTAESIDLLEPSVRQLGVIDTGVHADPVVSVHGRGKPAAPSASAPCAACGVLVLTGTMTIGQVVVMDPTLPTYTVVGLSHAGSPTLYASRAYPIHRCLHPHGKERP